MENNETPFFGSSEWKQEYERHLEELLKNPPHPVNFTYTVDQLKTIYSNFNPVVDNTPGPRYIEDYYEFHEDPKLGDVNKVISSIYEFYSLENKNDLSKVENIYKTIVDNFYGVKLPSEFLKAEQEISEHLNYLRDMRAINDYSQEQERIKLQQEKARIQQEQQLKEQQISPVERMDNFFNTVNGPEQKNSSQQQEETHAKLEQLKEQIEKYNSQIDTLLANIQPYMQVPKVNQEISKVIEKNNEINSSQTIDSLNDYKKVLEMKQSILTYLEQANKFINDSVGKKQEPAEEQQSIKKQNFSQPLSDNFSGKIYNDDGTYTREYINHVTATATGFNQGYYDKLMQENEFKRKQNEDPTSLLNDSNVWDWVNDEEQLSSNHKHI